MPERRRKVEGGEEPSSEDDEEEEEDSRASMWRGGKTVGLARQAIRQGADMAVTGHSAPDGRAASLRESLWHRARAESGGRLR